MNLLFQTIQEYLKENHPDWRMLNGTLHNNDRVYLYPIGTTICSKPSTIMVKMTGQDIRIISHSVKKTIVCAESAILAQIARIINKVERL